MSRECKKVSTCRRTAMICVESCFFGGQFLVEKVNIQYVLNRGFQQCCQISRIKCFQFVGIGDAVLRDLFSIGRTSVLRIHRRAQLNSSMCSIFSATLYGSICEIPKSRRRLFTRSSGIASPAGSRSVTVKRISLSLPLRRYRSWMAFLGGRLDIPREIVSGMGVLFGHALQDSSHRQFLGDDLNMVRLALEQVASPGAQWWTPERTTFVFIKHVAARWTIDAISGHLIWENQLVSSNFQTGTEFLSAGRASEILTGLLTTNPRYRQMVSAFQVLACLENEFTLLQDLKSRSRARTRRGTARSRSARGPAQGRRSLSDAS